MSVTFFWSELMLYFFCIWFLKHLGTYSRWRVTLLSTFIFSEFFQFWVRAFCYMLLLTAYNSALNYDLICLTETYLDSTVDPNNLLSTGYNLLWADHPYNVKTGGVCLYYRETLTLQLVDTPNIEQCIFCEINIQNTIGYIAVIYRSQCCIRQFFWGAGFSMTVARTKTVVQLVSLGWGGGL